VALVTGKVVVHSDGTPYRPVIHIRDLVRTFREYLEAPRETVHAQAFNNGADHLNYQIRLLAEIAVRVVPGSTLSIEARASADQRTYRANFAKFAAAFPAFRFEWTPETGAAELVDAFRQAELSRADLEAGTFVRLERLRKLMDEKKLDLNLRWT